MRELADFLNAPTGMGFAALALLGLFYLVRLGLDFYRTTILPRAYERRLLRRRLILPVAQQILDARWTAPAYFRDGNPKYVDFKEGCVFRRPEVEQAESMLDKGRFVLIQGPPSSGKTVIALNLTYEWARSKRSVLYFNRPALLTDAFFEFLSTPAAARLLDRKGAVVVLDDVHLDPARAARLFGYVYANMTRLALIFVSRPLRAETRELNSTEPYDFARYMHALHVRAEAVVEQVANHVSMRRFGRPIPPQVVKAFVEECGNDLLLMGRYLREWHGQESVHLPEIRRKVFQSVRGDLERLRALSKDAVTALLVASIFYRYEVPVERRFLEQELALDLAPVLAAGEVSEQNGFVLLHHSSMAKLYTNVCRSLRVPEFAALEAKFANIPASLFISYVRTGPRNICEMLVGLRRTRDVFPLLLVDADCDLPLRRGIERERDLNLLGWAMMVVYIASRRHGWRVVREIDLSGVAEEALSAATPDEISLFVFNLARISRTKGEEWVRCIAPAKLAGAIHSMTLQHAAATLLSVHQFSRTYFGRLVEALDPVAVCQIVQNEEDYDNLRQGLKKIGALLGDRACVKAFAFEDAFGDWTTRLSFYCGNVRVTRFLRGNKLGIPYGSSVGHQHAYFRALIRRECPGCTITVDAGAGEALHRRMSLFPVGVTSVQGEFRRGDVVAIRSEEGRQIGSGVSNFDAEELRRMKGVRSNDAREKVGLAPNRVMDNDLLVVGRRFKSLAGVPKMPAVAESAGEAI